MKGNEKDKKFVKSNKKKKQCKQKQKITKNKNHKIKLKKNETNFKRRINDDILMIFCRIIIAHFSRI